jgi:UPF0042 nucleotide-binding protein
MPARRARPRSTRQSRQTRRFTIVTGLSGSGKSHAIRALEDLGYFCIDNLPTQLIPTVADLALREEAGIPRMAIVVDVRESGFLTNFARVYLKLKQNEKLNPTLIFLEASDKALMRRFSETRRPHPLAKDRPVGEGIREERRKTNAIRAMADLILDTSNLTVHELRDAFRVLSEDPTERAAMVVTLTSFGFKQGPPADADLVFDVRCLPNPHFVPELKPLTGRDKPVVAFMRRHAATGAFLKRLTAFLTFALPQYLKEGKSYLTVAIGCTGGQHRSVMIAEALAKALAAVPGIRLRVHHRDS